MNNDLLPCPFCGAQGESLLVEHLEGTILHPAYQVHCDNCGASSGYTDKCCRETWNTRVALTPQWQPIETAPKDGSSILAYSDYMTGPNEEPVMWSAKYDRDMERFIALWDGEPWNEATHWMPLPAAPEVSP